MQKRTVVVNSIRIISVNFSSVFSLGDTKIARPTSKGIALQQREAVFAQEGGVFFEDYPLFKRRPDWPKQKTKISTGTTHHANTISVNHVAITGVSQASIAQAGSIGKIKADARIKHFRRLT